MSRPLEDISKWIYGKLFKHPYESGDYAIGLIFLFLGLILLFFAFMLVRMLVIEYLDKKTSTLENHSGTLIDKKYIGEESASGIGTAIVPDSNGGVGVGMVSTSSHQDEQFLFFLKSDMVYKCPVDMQEYYNKAIGDKINFTVLIGGKTGKQLKIDITP